MKYLVFFLIDFFKNIRIFPPSGSKVCRHIPSCSEYAREAVEKYGPLKGLALGLWRVLRCNPFSKKIYDPVP